MEQGAHIQSGFRIRSEYLQTLTPNEFQKTFQQVNAATAQNLPATPPKDAQNTIAVYIPHMVADIYCQKGKLLSQSQVIS